MRTLENPVLYEELVGPMVCWLEIELSLIESTYDVPALMLVLQPGRSSSLGPSVWHSPLANRSWAGTPPNRTLKATSGWSFRIRRMEGPVAVDPQQNRASHSSPELTSLVVPRGLVPFSC